MADTIKHPQTAKGARSAAPLGHSPETDCGYQPWPEDGSRSVPAFSTNVVGWLLIVILTGIVIATFVPRGAL